MAHLVETMAYAGQTPWHGLGNQLPATQPLEVWAEQAGMNWTIKESPVLYGDPSNNELVYSFDDKKVLMRSDNNKPLSVVSKKYNIVQPLEVLEFYRDLTEHAGYELETAGVLDEGKRFWALARTGESVSIKGDDHVNGYVLLATSCDGSLATIVTPTTVRVVCNNTLSYSIQGATDALKIPHNTVFRSEDIKRKLNLSNSSWDELTYRMKVLAERKVTDQEAEVFFTHVINKQHQLAAANDDKIPNGRAIKKMLEMFNGQGRGADLQAAKGTAWGLLSTVTEFVDHERQARTQSNRLNSAWFGYGANVKQKALNQALLLAA